VFSFEPNPDWSGFYAYSDEIQQYFLKFADKYGLRKYVQLNTEVVSATWDEEEGKCKSQTKLRILLLAGAYSILIRSLKDDVELRRDGKVFHDWCHVLINGSGVVNKWKCKSLSRSTDQFDH
jgi:hypothetical protein